MTGCGCSSGVVRDGWYPGVPGDGVADDGEGVVSVLDGGGCVAADGVPVAGGFLRAEPPGDFLLGFGGACVAFCLVVRRRDRGVGQEPEDVVLAVLQAFQQAAGGRLFLVAAGDAGHLRQAHGDAVAEQAQVLRGLLVRYAGQSASRARLAAWMRARSSPAIWPGQIASG